jgi:hypothetical protein
VSIALTLFAMILGAAMILFGLHRMIFRPGKRKLGFYTLMAAPIISLMIIFVATEMDARSHGWESLSDKASATEAGVFDPTEWQSAKETLAREKEAADALAAAKAAEEKADERRKGFHCLSAWSGHSEGLVDAVKAQLREPESFEAIKTLIAPVDNGSHAVLMTYRARNGFGGMNVAEAAATIDTETCAVTLLLAE